MEQGRKWCALYLGTDENASRRNQNTFGHAGLEVMSTRPFTVDLLHKYSIDFKMCQIAHVYIGF
jgi:hypothetical protein